MTKYDTRQRILDCALSLFSKNGYKATTIKEIASLAKINEITIFRHFDSKEGLLNEIFKMSSGPGIDTFFANLQGDLIQDLTSISNRVIDSILDNGPFMKFCIIEVSFNSSIGEAVLNILKSYTNLLSAYLNSLASREIIPAANFELMSQMFFNLIHQYAFSKLGQMNSFATQPKEKEEFINYLVDLFTLRLTQKN